MTDQQSKMVRTVQAALIDAEGPAYNGEDAFYGPMARAAIAVIERELLREMSEPSNEMIDALDGIGICTGREIWKTMLRAFAKSRNIDLPPSSPRRRSRWLRR